MKRMNWVAPWGEILMAVLVVVLLCAGQCFAYNPGDPELRAFWVDAWGTGFMTQPQVDTLLGVPGTSSTGQLRDANCNAIVMQVRRNCDANYPSHPGLAPNGVPYPSEPYMGGLTPSNFNALQAVINAAHDTSNGKKRIEVHAWMVTFRTSGGTVYGRHSDAPTGSLTTLDNYWPSRDDSGAEVSDKAFDPGHPLAEEYTANVALDLVNNFDIDGIHYDYIRFTAGNQGYNPTSIARYNARYGLTGQPSPTDDQFDQWRRDQISALVRKVYAKIQTTKPWVKQSGSFVTWNPSPPSSTRAGFQTTRPYGNRSQGDGVFSDWDAWMQEGIVDAAIPMTYYDLGGSYPADWTRWINYEKDRHGNRHMYIGPGIYMNSLNNAITEVLQTRTASPAGNYADGFCCYSLRTPYVGGNAATFLARLKTDVTQTWADVPVMPWKTSPTKGHISGTVTYSTGGAWADGAQVAITGPESRSMYVDGTGFYAFIDLTPGVYTVTASKSGYADAVSTVTVAIGSVTGNMYVTNFQLGGTPELTISSVGSSGITTGGATITWDTNLPASSQVEYGLTASYGSTTTLNSTLVTSHTQSIVGLTAGTLYHYRVRSSIGADVKYSGDYTFTTNGPPTISNVLTTSITTTTATITWNTNTPADSKVNYGLVATYESSTGVNSTYLTSHSMVLTSLMEDTLYHFQCVSANAYGTATTSDYTFTTAKTPDGEIVIDNRDSGWASTGSSWSVGSNPAVPMIGTDYLYYAGQTSATRRCTWTPYLPAEGYYDVYAFYQIGANRNSAATYTTHYSGGQIASVQNQYSPVPNQGGWFLIAENMPFAAGSTGYVELTNQSTDTSDISVLVSADAAKWVYRGPFDQTPPTVSIGAPSGTLTKSGPITYTITYGGADFVTLANGNIALNKTGTANGTAAVTGSGTASRTVTVSGITGTGTLGISVAAGTASDLAGNLAPAAGPSTTFTADDTAPAINSVSVTPPMAAVGDAIRVAVDTTDNVEVTGVTANGTTLAKSGGNTWAGNILAIDPLVVHGVTIIASDASGNSATNASATYKTAQVVGASSAAAWQPVMYSARGLYLFKVWGKVAEIDDDYFTLGDGSAVPVMIHAPGYRAKVLAGDDASARGILDISGLIESELGLITKY